VRHAQEAGAVGVAMAAAVGLGIYKNFESLKQVVGLNLLMNRRLRTGRFMISFTAPLKSYILI